jgi:hypothetical protein
MGAGGFLSGNKARRDMKLITHLHLLLEVKEDWSYRTTRRPRLLVGYIAYPLPIPSVPSLWILNMKMDKTRHSA